MASGKLEGFGKSLGGLGAFGKVATVGLAAVATAGVGLVAGLASSVGQAAAFEKVISQVGAVSGASGKELAGLSDLALKMGADTAFSASEAAQAMAELAKGGIAVGDMAKILPGVLDLAAAGGIGLAQAATIATDTMAIFAKQGVNMDQVANAFAGAANISSISVDDMANSMKYVGPIANAMGLSLEDTSAAIALLGANGLKGDQAGTGLRTMLTSLAAPSKEAKKVIAGLGLEFFDSSGKMKDFAGISDELKGALSGMTDAQRAATLETLFGKEGMASALAIMGDGENSIKSYTEKLRNASTAHATGKAMMDNFAGSMEALKGSVESAAITLGLAFLPVLRQMVDGATAGVNAALPFIKAWGPQLAAGLGAGLTGLRDLATAFVSTAASVRNFAQGGNDIATTINGFSGPFAGAARVVTLLINAFRDPENGIASLVLGLSGLAGVGLPLAAKAAGIAQEAFDALRNPIDFLQSKLLQLAFAFPQLFGVIGPVVIALERFAPQIAAVAAGFLALGPAVRIAMMVLPALLGAFTGIGPIVGILTSTLPVLGTIIAALGGPITLAIIAIGALGLAWSQNWFGIRDATMPIITQIVGFVTGTLIPGLTQLGTYVATVLWPQMQTAWTGIQAAITAAIAAVLPTLVQFGTWLTGTLLPAVQQLIAVAVPAFQQLGAAVIAAFQAALPGIQAFIAGAQQLGAVVLPIIGQVASVIIDSLGPAVLAILAWATEVIPQFSAAWTNVMTIVAPIVGAIAALIGATLGAIAGFITEHSAQIQAILGGAWTAMSNAIGAVLTIITGLISTALLVIAGDWSGAWARLQQTATTAWGQIQTAIGGMVTAIINLIAIGLQEAQQAAAAVWEGIKSTAANAWNDIKAIVSAAVNALPGIVMAIGGAMFAAGASIITQLAAGIDSAIGIAIQKVRDGIQQIADLLPGSEPKDSSSPLRGLGERGEAIFGNLADGIGKGTSEAVKAAADAASAVAKAVTDVLGASRALAGFKDSDRATGEQMGWFREATSSMVATMQAAAEGFSEDGLKATNLFADAASKVGGSIKNTLEGLAALARFDFARDTPSGHALAWFTHLATSLVANFEQAASYFTEESLKAASAFADASAKVGGSVSAALTGLQALARADWADSSPSGSAMSWFTHLIASLVENFATAAAGFAEGALDAASDFAEAASKVGGAVSGGLAGLSALASADWAKSSPSGSAMAWFTHLLASLTQNFATAAAGFESGALAAAGLFAEAAGKVAGVIGPAVAGFAAMLDFKTPDPAIVDQLLEAIKYVVRRFGEMAATMEEEGVKHLAAFSAAAGTALASAKTGTDLFKAFDKLGIPSAKAIDELMEGIKYVVARFREMAAAMETEGIAQMQTFADAAGKVLAAAKSGTDLFTSMEKLAVPSAAAIDYLLGSIGYVITQTRAIATGIGTEGLAQAQAFATGTLSVFNTIKAALESFAGLAKYKDIPTDALREVWVALEGALAAAADNVARSDAIKNDMATFANNMKDAVRYMTEGLSLGQQLGAAQLTAPAGVGGGGGGGAGGGGGGTSTVVLNMNGDVYDAAGFEDKVVSALQTADKRGR